MRLFGIPCDLSQIIMEVRVCDEIQGILDGILEILEVSFSVFKI